MPLPHVLRNQGRRGRRYTAAGPPHVGSLSQLNERLEHLLVHDERDGGGGRGSHRVRHAALEKAPEALLAGHFRRAMKHAAITGRSGLDLLGGASLLEPRLDDLLPGFEQVNGQKVKQTSYPNVCVSLRSKRELPLPAKAKKRRWRV